MNKGLAAILLAVGLVANTSGASVAAEKLVVSSWGGNWRDLIAETIGKKFTEQTGAEVEFITGGTIDRLNQAQLASGEPESDVSFTTAHVGWLYNTGDLFETLDMSRIPNAEKIFPDAIISDKHLGVWSYVYSIAYRPDLVPEGMTFESWDELWDPRLANTIGLSDFDPSSIIAATSTLVGVDAGDWESAQDKLKELKPNIKTYFGSDAVSEQLITTGETPVQVMLSMMAHQLIDQGVPMKITIPKEGAVMNFDAIGIMKGTKKTDLAYAFINAALDPEVQAEIVRIKKGGPTVENVEISEDIASRPGVFLTPTALTENSIMVDAKLRSEKLSEWRTWFSENMIAQ